MQSLGEYIVTHSPTAQRLSLTLREQLNALVPKRFRSGLKWKVPKPPTNVLTDFEPERDYSGLVWVAICLHADSFAKYLGLQPKGFYFPLACLNNHFLTVLNALLIIHGKSQSPQERRLFGHAAIAGLCSFIEIAERNYGTLRQELESQTGDNDWCLDLSEHAIGFAQFHLKRLKGEAAILSEEDKKEYQYVYDEYKAACTEIAQMDLSRWAEESLRLKENLSDDSDADERGEEEDSEGRDYEAEESDSYYDSEEDSNDDSEGPNDDYEEDLDVDGD
jgi:hypothetical protein